MSYSVVKVYGLPASLQDKLIGHIRSQIRDVLLWDMPLGHTIGNISIFFPSLAHEEEEGDDVVLEVLLSPDAEIVEKEQKIRIELAKMIAVILKPHGTFSATVCTIVMKNVCCASTK